MPNMSFLDKKFFTGSDTYNCPFCKRNNVYFSLENKFTFQWTEKKMCYVYFVKCRSCDNTSMHLSYEEISANKNGWLHFTTGSIDEHVFYSAPNSFFVIDIRIPKEIRELISEAESCLKMNFLTGASACIRKSIYELLVIEKSQGENYEKKIKSLKNKYPLIEEESFNVLSQIQDMTSDKVHEQSWLSWDATNLKLIIESLKSVLQDLYVLPKEKEERAKLIQKLHNDVKLKKEPG